MFDWQKLSYSFGLLFGAVVAAWIYGVAGEVWAWAFALGAALGFVLRVVYEIGAKNGRNDA